MATDELDLHNLGAYEEALDDEMDQEATQDVAEESEEQVAEEAADDGVSDDDEGPEDDGAAPVSQSDFSAWQSKYDKKMAALEKENEALKTAKAEPPSGPSTQELRTFTDLKKQFADARSYAVDGTTQEERDYGNYQAGLLRGKLIEAESVVVAREVGIDPDSAEYQSLLSDSEIRTSSDIQRVAWQAKATSTPAHETSESLEARKKQVEADEMSVAEQVAEEVERQMVTFRQNTGMNATPGTQPGGVKGGKAGVIRAYQKAKASGNIDKVLQMKAQYKFLG